MAAEPGPAMIDRCAEQAADCAYQGVSQQPAAVVGRMEPGLRDARLPPLGIADGKRHQRPAHADAVQAADKAGDQNGEK